jgi:ubiquitin C-terminal hydrolase
MIPRADATTEDGEEASLFGVSLVFQRRLVTTPSVPVAARAQTFFPDAVAQSEPTFDPKSSNSDTETEVGLNSEVNVQYMTHCIVSTQDLTLELTVNICERLQERSGRAYRVK